MHVWSSIGGSGGSNNSDNIGSRDPDVITFNGNGGAGGTINSCVDNSSCFADGSHGGSNNSHNSGDSFNGNGGRGGTVTGNGRAEGGDGGNGNSHNIGGTNGNGGNGGIVI